MFVEFVSGVHAPGGAQGAGQHRADGEHARTAVLQAGVQDVRGVYEEIRARLVGLCGDFPSEVGDLGFSGAPGEVGIRLGEAKPRQPVEPGRACEGLREEEDVGVGGFDLADQPLPEVGWLGMRIVHPEYLDAVGNPVLNHPQYLGVEARRICVEVQRVDVLVLLRRVLRVGDGPVGKLGEPLGMRAHPRVIGCALQCEVQRNLQTQLQCGGDEPIEVLEGAELGMDGVVTTGDAADRPR
ncbi:Uncharacterised protein [Mycobacteroides abscessus subsp. abscessus]|nr:Uncharacterised protein [Mycobacteroides abscessus subsp. abscessus]